VSLTHSSLSPLRLLLNPLRSASEYVRATHTQQHYYHAEPLFSSHRKHIRITFTMPWFFWHFASPLGKRLFELVGGLHVMNLGIMRGMETKKERAADMSRYWYKFLLRTVACHEIFARTLNFLCVGLLVTESDGFHFSYNFVLSAVKFKHFPWTLPHLS
jgi:hypothetical protein